MWKIINDIVVACDLSHNHTLYITRTKTGIDIKLMQYIGEDRKLTLFMKSITDKQLGFTFEEKNE